MRSTARTGREFTFGKRKTAMARVFVRPGNGVYTVNGRDAWEYFGNDSKAFYTAFGPLIELKVEDQYNVEAFAKGSGLVSQAGAVSLGVARGLDRLQPNYHGLLRKYQWLTSDGRNVERKKVGLHSARRRHQYSKR
uniref:30S ribosomal protein S9 n=2 Tax=Chromera velia TaxID=505693 RepID=A0A0G4HXQ6_9ALVE|eukprot:Cvel_9313.t1-p1 / transcript=Cvel_9313.t1 / gene=Cvel_9313 / organism=Chromera_velia_CCMP2878 / gene_product=30S ribosomal protein S9, putative / transcript_product=30S ribosomal protein S9, putative / location=Cvel_scaffold534:6953-7357(-) / protein_length=135 / sequence_SO=supercontig / SO=protein_coding / is_pseudo=false